MTHPAESEDLRLCCESLGAEIRERMAPKAESS